MYFASENKNKDKTKTEIEWDAGLETWERTKDEQEVRAEGVMAVGERKTEKGDGSSEKREGRQSAVCRPLPQPLYVHSQAPQLRLTRPLEAGSPSSTLSTSPVCRPHCPPPDVSHTTGGVCMVVTECGEGGVAKDC